VEPLWAGLRDLGYVEGKNIVIHFRWVDSVEQLPGIAAELVRMNVDVIFAPSSTMVEPARHSTKTIPIVFYTHADPLGTGHVEGLARIAAFLLQAARAPCRACAQASASRDICYQGGSGGWRFHELRRGP
jgi:hypothetical protein